MNTYQQACIWVYVEFGFIKTVRITVRVGNRVKHIPHYCFPPEWRNCLFAVDHFHLSPLNPKPNPNTLALKLYPDPDPAVLREHIFPFEPENMLYL